MQKYILFLMCALVSACSTDVNGNPCNIALSGCAANADTQQGDAGGQLDGNGGLDGQGGQDSSDSSDEDTGIDAGADSSTDVAGGEGYLLVKFNTLSPQPLEVWDDGEYDNAGSLTFYPTYWFPKNKVASTNEKELSITFSAGQHQIAFKQEGMATYAKGVLNPDTEEEQPNLPFPIEIKAGETTKIEIIMYPDGTGYWNDGNDNFTHTQLVVFKDTDYCPGGSLGFLGFCLREGNTFDTCPQNVGKCKENGSVRMWGTISPDGKTINGTYENPKTGKQEPFVYTYTGKGD